MPKKYALIEEEPWKHEGVRKIIVKNFLIYYWVDEENFKVQVIAVIYNPYSSMLATDLLRTFYPYTLNLRF